MDYKEKYNAALDRAKEALLTSTTYQMFVIEEIFSELKENEDEQIRKSLISFLKSPFVHENIIDDIKPIPLTAEILKKNGFIEFMPHNWQIVIDNIMIELREPQHNMAIWLDWEEHDTGTYASYILPGPNCVHELQHALRLCNIDKEITI